MNWKGYYSSISRPVGYLTCFSLSRNQTLRVFSSFFLCPFTLCLKFLSLPLHPTLQYFTSSPLRSLTLHGPTFPTLKLDLAIIHQLWLIFSDRSYNQSDLCSLYLFPQLYIRKHCSVALSSCAERSLCVVNVTQLSLHLHHLQLYSSTFSPRLNNLFRPAEWLHRIRFS